MIYLFLVRYLGYFPLGSEVLVDGVQIMMKEWGTVTPTPLVIGRANRNIGVFGNGVFGVVENEKKVFFIALEYGIGKYHVFTFSDRASKKLSKRSIKFENYSSHGTTYPVFVNKKDNTVKIYGRFLFSKDENGHVPDSFVIYDHDELIQDELYIYFKNSILIRVIEPKISFNNENGLLVLKAKNIILDYKIEDSNVINHVVKQFSLKGKIVEVCESTNGKIEDYRFKK